MPIAIVLCARRPFHLIGSPSDIELLPYIVELRAAAERTSLFAAEGDEVVAPAMQLDVANPALLRRVSGAPRNRPSCDARVWQRRLQDGGASGALRCWYRCRQRQGSPTAPTTWLAMLSLDPRWPPPRPPNWPASLPTLVSFPKSTIAIWSQVSREGKVGASSCQRPQRTR